LEERYKRPIGTRWRQSPSFACTVDSKANAVDRYCLAQTEVTPSKAERSQPVGSPVVAPGYRSKLGGNRLIICGMTPGRIGSTVCIGISVGEDARFACDIVSKTLKQATLIIEVAAP
jgi:hypothetical protein